MESMTLLEPNEDAPHVTEFLIERVEGELMAVNSFRPRP